MQVLPVANYRNNLSVKGRVGSKVSDLTKNMSEGWLNTATNGKYKTLPIINVCCYASQRINNAYLNLMTVMERFGQACELTFAKSEKTGIHRFFIENKYSNYKLMCGDIEFSPKINKLTDIDKLESLEKKMEKLNPYQENSNFLIQRKTDAQGMLFDKEFAPSEDYVFLEDRLIGKEPLPEATMNDLEEFLEAAKEDGVI